MKQTEQAEELIATSHAANPSVFALKQRQFL